MGVPRRTVLDWRHRKRSDRVRVSGCPICSDARLDRPTYAYLLGLYLGDGCISHGPRAQRLRITLDHRYPGILAEAAAAIDRMVPSPRAAGFVQCDGCVEVYGYWKHWTCLFPQHGPGVKHMRAIILEGWQQEIADEHPDRLLRGLIHSDGWRGTNRVIVRGIPYEYPRYQFTNHSAGIRDIFCRACDVLGVSWTQMTWNTVSVARRSEVEKLDLVVGPKV